MGMGYDAVVVGEGEPSLDLAMVGEGVFNSPVLADLDALPVLDRSMFSGYKGPSPMMAGRGCPFNCAFCDQTVRKTRCRSAKGVAEELAAIPGEEAIFFWAWRAVGISARRRSA
jgi:radical SAM superfamily enzyme YgiQ (UPF0313 family)